MADMLGILKVTAVSLTMVAATVGGGFNGISVPLIGVPLTAVTMAAAGAMCAFAWPRAETSRSRLFGVTLASTFVGASCVGVIPHLFGAAWPKELQAPLAFLFGLLAPWVVPAFRGAIPALFKGLSEMIIRMVGGKLPLANRPEAEPDEYEPEVYTPKKPTKQAPNEQED